MEYANMSKKLNNVYLIGKTLKSQQTPDFVVL